MLRLFFIINIISLSLYPSVWFVHLNNNNAPPYFNVIFLLFVSMLFLSLRALSTIIKHLHLKISKNILGYIIAIFTFIFPFSGVFVSAYLDDKKQIIPYILFQIYYFVRFYPVLKQLEVSYHV